MPTRRDFLKALGVSLAAPKMLMASTSEPEIIGVDYSGEYLRNPTAPGLYRQDGDLWLPVDAGDVRLEAVTPEDRFLDYGIWVGTKDINRWDLSFTFTNRFLFFDLQEVMTADRAMLFRMITQGQEVYEFLGWFADLIATEERVNDALHPRGYRIETRYDCRLVTDAICLFPLQ